MYKSALGFICAAVFLICESARCEVVKLYEGDSVTVGDEWQLKKVSEDLPDKTAPIFMAGLKDGCGIRLDNAGAQKKTDFKATTAQYDDYLNQLLATAGLKVKSAEKSAETRVAGFRALVKDYKLDIQGSEWGARVVQFNSENHLYSAWTLSPSNVKETECFEKASKVLESFESGKKR